jgi:hypothetical protein
MVGTMMAAMAAASRGSALRMIIRKLYEAKPRSRSLKL